jgi:hypothetical protein
MCDLRRTERSQGSVRQIVLGGNPSSLANRSRYSYRLSGFFYFGKRRSMARSTEEHRLEAYAMLHWPSELSSDLPEPSRELSPRTWSDDAAALK